jgi:hypothetical protein
VDQDLLDCFLRSFFHRQWQLAAPTETASSPIDPSPDRHLRSWLAAVSREGIIRLLNCGNSRRCSVNGHKLEELLGSERSHAGGDPGAPEERAGPGADHQDHGR